MGTIHRAPTLGKIKKDRFPLPVFTSTSFMGMTYRGAGMTERKTGRIENLLI